MYLAIPASSADLERTFSSAGFLNEGRESLLPGTLEMQVVLRDWLLEVDDGDKDRLIEECEHLIAALMEAVQSIKVRVCRLSSVFTVATGW
jgi:hypothetical protein